MAIRGKADGCAAFDWAVCDGMEGVDSDKYVRIRCSAAIRCELNSTGSMMRRTDT